MTGDVDRFEAFCRDQLGSLKRLLLNMAFSETIAEEAAQDALCQAYKYWDTIDDPAAWVRTTARRLAVRETKRVNTLFCLDPDIEPDRFDSWMLWPNIKADHHPVLEAVRGLPDRQRYVMAYTIEGFEPREIADELGMKPETVRSHLRHARARLRRHLREGGMFDV